MLKDSKFQVALVARARHCEQEEFFLVCRVKDWDNPGEVIHMAFPEKQYSIRAISGALEALQRGRMQPTKSLAAGLFHQYKDEKYKVVAPLLNVATAEEMAFCQATSDKSFWLGPCELFASEPHDFRAKRGTE